MKKLLSYLFVAFLSVLVITGCGSKKDKKDDKKEDVKFEVDSVSAEKFKNEYEQYNDIEVNGVVLMNLDIPEENPIHYATYEELLTIFDETSIVFFGSPTSVDSREIIETLFETAKANDISRIYYVNLNNFENQFENQGGQIVKTVNEQEGYYEVLDKLFLELDEYFIDGMDVGEKRISAPSIFFIQDGTVIGKYTSASFADEEEETKTKKISQKFNYYMEQIYSDYCSDQC